MPFRTGLDAVQQIAFADNADELAVAVQHRNRADLLFEKQLCNLLHGGGGAHGNDRGNHDVSDKHGTSPINGMIIENPEAAPVVDSGQVDPDLIHLGIKCAVGDERSGRSGEPCVLSAHSRRRSAAAGPVYCQNLGTDRVATLQHPGGHYASGAFVAGRIVCGSRNGTP